MKAPTRPALIALACCLILSPLWLLTMFHRGIWTPDEPREADIAWRMSVQSQRAIPTLAGEAFAEKPPLAYWASGAAAAAFPGHDAALRLPNLLFAWLATAALVLLAAAWGGNAAAWIAGFTFGTFVLTLQVMSWLAVDAALLSGVTVALLGAARGVYASTPRAQLGWFTVLNVALAWTFLTKGPAAWLVPLSALGVLLFIERQRRVLRSPAFWLPTLIPVGSAALWIWAVSRTPDGTQNLSVLLWWNVAGRFVHLDAAQANPYSLGHPSYPGKYLLELPFYLAPWIFLFIAALRRSAFRMRSPDGAAWQFAVATVAIALLALSFAGTARGIYFAPLLPACALLIGLWYRESLFAAARFDRIMLWATYGLVAALCTVLLLASGIIALSEPKWRTSIGVLAVGAVLAFASLAMGRHHLRARRARAFMTLTGFAYLATFIVCAIVILPAIDRWQDLGSIARAIDRDSASRMLVLYKPDETTRAMLDRATHGRPAVRVSSPEDLAPLMSQHDVAVLLLLRGHADGPPNQTLRSWGLRVAKPPAPLPQLQELNERLGLKLEHLYEVPLGRRYALLAKVEEKRAP